MIFNYPNEIINDLFHIDSKEIIISFSLSAGLTCFVFPNLIEITLFKDQSTILTLLSEAQLNENNATLTQ